jgi:hypothetical protein
MLLLTTTSDLVQLITGSALSTDIVTSYVDITTTGVTPGSFQANVATATTTTIVASPASATQRQVKMISVRNNSTTTAQTVTVQKSTGTAYNITGAITLNPGEVLYYQDMYGFSVRDINGQIKQTINTTSASLTSTYVGYGNSSGVLTGSSTLTYSATGNLVVGAPTTSTAAALTVTGVARTGYGSTVQINAPNTTGQSNGLAITSGTNSSDAPFVLTNAASTFNYYALLGDSSWSYFRAASAPTLICSATGNLSISAPSSGVALGINGVSGQVALQVNSGSGTSTGSDIYISRNGSTANTIAQGPSLQLYDATNATSTILQNSGGQTELWQYNSSAWNQILKVASTRGVTFNAPASGTTLTVSGVGGLSTGALLVDSPSANTTVPYANYNLYLTNNTQTASNFSCIGFGGLDSGGINQISSAAIMAQTTNHTSGSVTGQLIFYTTITSTLTQRGYFGTLGGFVVGAPSGADKGAGTINASTVYAGGTALTSDARIKKNITPITNAIDNIKLLNGVTFDWIDRPGSSVGLIAQDVEAIYPQLVEGSGDEIKSLHYNGIIGVLVEAVKEQQSQIEELKALVQQLLTK